MEGSCPTPKCGQDVVASFPEVLDGGQRELQWRKLLQPGDQDQSHEKLGWWLVLLLRLDEKGTYLCGLFPVSPQP